MAETTKNPKDEFDYLKGKIDAVALLVSSVVAKLSPDLARPILDAILVIKTQSKSAPLSAYETGFASLEAILIRTLKAVEEAKTVRDLKSPLRH